MAGASMKDIKLRIRSVESTMQITKAMQLVASSKLRGARARMEASKPYMKVARTAVWDIALHNTGAQSHYVIPRQISQRCYIVNSDCTPEAEALAEVLKEKFPISEVVIGDIGPVIGSHTGKDTIAVFFQGQERNSTFGNPTKWFSKV